MARKINFSKPLNEEDAAYVADRPWLLRDAELQGLKVEFGDEQTDGSEVEDGDEDVAYEDMTNDQLLELIRLRNEEKDDDDQIVPDSKKKADLVAALELDDEESDEDDSEDDTE